MFIYLLKPFSRNRPGTNCSIKLFNKTLEIEINEKYKINEINTKLIINEKINEMFEADGVTICYFRFPCSLTSIGDRQIQ